MYFSDVGPSFGVILSAQPVHLAMPDPVIQLDSNFIIFPLPTGVLELPMCPAVATKLYYMPRSPDVLAQYIPPELEVLESLGCAYAGTCGICEANQYQDLSSTFCNMKFGEYPINSHILCILFLFYRHLKFYIFKEHGYVSVYIYMQLSLYISF